MQPFADPGIGDGQPPGDRAAGRRVPASWDPFGTGVPSLSRTAETAVPQEGWDALSVEFHVE